MANPGSPLTASSLPGPVKVLLKIVYLPFGIAFGLISGVVARKLFEAVWAKIDEREPPEPTTAEIAWPKAVGAAALKSATFSATKAGGERLSAGMFQYLFGVWPGERQAEESDA